MSFGPWPEKRGPEGGADRGDQNLGISTFYVKGTPAKIGHGSILVLFDSLIRLHPEGPTGTPGPWEGRKSKVKIGYFFGRDPPTKSNSKNILFYSFF